VQSPERLKLLLYDGADIRAVGPSVEWLEGGAAARIVPNAHELISGGAQPIHAMRASPPRRRKRANCCPSSPRRNSPPLLAAAIRSTGCRSTRDHARHARLMPRRIVAARRSSVENAHRAAARGDRDHLYTADHAGLFSRIAGALAVNVCNIVDAQDHDDDPTAWRSTHSGSRTTTASPSTGRTSSPALGRIRERADRDLKPHANSPARRDPEPHQRVHRAAARLIDNQASLSHTVIEVNGRDRPGLLHELTAS